MAWRVYLTLDQARSSALCVLAALLVPSHTIRAMFWTSAIWYGGQACDEWFYGNHFYDGLWEYWALALVAIDLTLYLSLHERESHAR